MVAELVVVDRGFWICLVRWAHYLSRHRVGDFSSEPFAQVTVFAKDPVRIADEACVRDIYHLPMLD